MNNGPIDFLVLAPLPEEIAALLKEFKIDETNGSTLGNATFYSAECSDKNIRIVQLPYQGVMRAAAYATKFILRWRPACVVSFGIAGTISDDVNVCDVLVANRVFYYEPAKESAASPSDNGHSSGIQGHKGKIEGAPDWFETGDFASIAASVKNELIIKRKCWLKTGAEVIVASGEKKIADGKARSRRLLLDEHRKACAVEMEAAGVAAAVACIDPSIKPKLLVIKGISDMASSDEISEGQKKNPQRKSNRYLAAQRAATTLKMIIEKWNHAYSANHGEKIKKVRELAHLVKTDCYPDLVDSRDVSDLLLSRVIRDLDSLPSIFYHWRVHEHVHWLDFCYLLLLRRIQNLSRPGNGFPVVLLIDDTQETPREWKCQTTKIIQAVFQGAAQICWRTDMSHKAAIYQSFAAQMGLDLAAKEEFVEQIASATKASEFHGFCPWLEYISWSASTAGRCILLPWIDHIEKRYRYILSNLYLDALLVPRPTVCLNGKLAKTEAPGKGLIIDPPRYQSILAWLAASPDPQVVVELAKYLSLGNQNDILPAPAGTYELLKPWPELIEKLYQPDVDSNFHHATFKLLTRMVEWNRDFFKT